MTSPIGPLQIIAVRLTALSIAARDQDHTNAECVSALTQVRDEIITGLGIPAELAAILIRAAMARSLDASIPFDYAAQALDDLAAYAVGAECVIAEAQIPGGIAAQVGAVTARKDRLTAQLEALLADPV